MTSDLMALRNNLYRFINRRVGDHWISEDLVQETFYRFLHYGQDRPVADSTAFCLRIAANLLSDHFRNRRDASTEALDDEIAVDAPAADDIVMHRQRVEQLQRIIAGMPRLRREVFLRRRLHGQSLGEICQAVGLSNAAVKKHMVRAVEEIRQEIAKAHKKEALRNPS